MASVNKVILIGNLTQDAEVRSFSNGGKLANVRLATNERWTDKTTGEKKESSEYHTVVFSDRLAEIAGQYLRKGSPVYVEGSLRTRKWQDQNGNDRYATEVRGLTLQLLGGKPEGQAPQHRAPERSSQAPAGGVQQPPAFHGDDIPFIASLCDFADVPSKQRRMAKYDY